MTFPWETKPVRPELMKDPVTGLYPGQQHPDDVPGFLRRVRMPDGTVHIGLKNVSPANSLPNSTPASLPLWASTS